MILDIDVGNTRLKWMLRSPGSQPLAQGFVNHVAPLERVFSEVNLQDLHRVRVCCVKPEMANAMVSFFVAQSDVEPEFASVIDGAAGLRCGYHAPQNLGVDRWLAAIACWQNLSRSAIVVDAGSALTIDVLDGISHRGGYILPGMTLMAKALGMGTSGVKVQYRSDGELTPGSDTPAAVNHGSLLAAVAAIEKVASQWAPVKVVLTGGDAPLLRCHLAKNLDIIEEPNLVMNGLEVVLP